MTKNKRYNIKPSNIIEDGFCIQDDEKEHSFPTISDKSNLIMYEKALNEQDDKIKQLESCNHSLAQKQHRKLTKIIELEKENEKLKIDIMGQSEEIEILSDENKRLRCINKQLEERLDKSIALDMSKCGDVE